LFRDRLGLADDLDIVSLVVGRWSGSRKSIAALATTVCEAAARGDEAAAAIVTAAVAELVTLVETTRTQLGFTADDVVPVSYSGGMFADSGFRARFCDEINGLPSQYELRRPLLEPVLGAAIYAAKRNGTPLRAAAIRQLGCASSHQSA
jgi:N-acetylglucosamine kinase-like BadF-type ATPase